MKLRLQIPESSKKRDNFLQYIYICIYIHTHIYTYIYVCGPGSSVGIATDYDLDSPGIESQWGRDFPPVQTGPGAHAASCTQEAGWVPGYRVYPGGKVRPGRAADHSPPSSAEVLEE